MEDGLEVGGWMLVDGGLKLDACSWKQEDGDWWMKAGGWRLEVWMPEDEGFRLET